MIILDFDTFSNKKEKQTSMKFYIYFMKAENYYLWSGYM